MNTAPYYTGDNVPLKFEVSDAGGAVEPTDAKIVIFKPDTHYTDEDNATINGNEVSYLVPIDVTDIEGEYHAFFVLTLPGGAIRTHMMKFNVLHNPS